MKTIFKKYFVSGALVLVPIVMTVWILKAVILWCEDLFTSIVPTPWRPINLFGFELPGLGLLFTIFLVVLTGVITRLYIGSKLLAVWDKIINKVPFGNTIYRAVKQFTETVASSKQQSFRQVVLIQFPVTGNHMIGFITGDTPDPLKNTPDRETVNVFIPTSPNPTSGFLVVAPRENLKYVNMTPERAFKLIISGGTIVN
ncbi:MAG: DUF502 domain-containing protein [Deltaproteobacteria bacterium]|nr:DUF502 domain-containing protein [Deltaproteobacteria bacterium]MDZ4224999.1 DUF502 domain-containing protein [bacterium]